jgi:hypothetical protein
LGFSLNFRHCILLLSVGLFFNEGLFAQTIVYGSNNYVEYQVGNLPVVIAVSHGGNLEPTSIPDRTCNNAVLVSDAFTNQKQIFFINGLLSTFDHFSFETEQDGSEPKYCRGCLRKFVGGNSL